MSEGEIEEMHQRWLYFEKNFPLKEPKRLNIKIPKFTFKTKNIIDLPVDEVEKFICNCPEDWLENLMRKTRS